MSDPLSRDSIASLAQALVRIPSVNPAIAPDEAHGERAVSEFACAWLNDHGVRAWVDEVQPGRTNVVGEVVGGPGPTLVLCAHLDTVGTAQMTIPPFEPTIEGDRLYGRGSYDMKGAAAAAMCAGAALAKTPFPGKLLLSLVADEEYASIGAADFVARYPADACILTEASDLELVLAHKGFVWSEITARGRAAHGSRWDLGLSAIGKMGEVICALERFDRDTLRKRRHPLVGPASMHCALISGGAGLTTYSPECVLKTERRTLPGETADQVLAELRAVAGGAADGVEVRNLFDRLPHTCDRDEPIAQCLRRAAETVTGKTPGEIGVAYWMDAALFGAAGIPTVDYGPSGAGAHEPVEWVDLASLEACAKVYAETARTLHQVFAAAKRRSRGA